MAFQDILTNIYYGNTVQEWAIALLIILAATIAGKALYWIFGSIVRAFTKRTKTKADDLIVDLIEEPIVFALTIFGIWYGIGTLNMTEGAAIFAWDVIQVLIVLDVAWLVSRLFEAFFEHFLKPLAEKSETDLDDHLLPIIRKGTKILIWVLAIIIALNNAGYNVGALLAGLGIGGLALAMAAKDTLANVFGGLMILTDKPFKLGDRVQVSGYDGKVSEIGLRSTRLKTLAGRTVVIPNHVFSDSPIENVSDEPSRKVILELGLTYDTKPQNMEKAMKLLKDISKKNKHIEEDILLSFNKFNDSSMGITYIYYIKKDEDIFETQTEINMEILKQFNKNKLEFAFPTQTIYTKKS